MKSGLEGRNNRTEETVTLLKGKLVSMKSGLEGRNNPLPERRTMADNDVSMKSGLEGRNNVLDGARLNEVRPRRPEQFPRTNNHSGGVGSVSMKSGLEGRNNRPCYVVAYIQDDGSQ